MNRLTFEFWMTMAITADLLSVFGESSEGD